MDAVEEPRLNGLKTFATAITNQLRLLPTWRLSSLIDLVMGTGIIWQKETFTHGSPIFLTLQVAPCLNPKLNH